MDQVRESHEHARRISGKLFDRMLSRGVRARRWAKLWGKSNDLNTLNPLDRVTGSGTIRIIVVPLNRIVGSQDRSTDFDADFNPLKAHIRERWISVAAARRIGVVLPPVELVQAWDGFYVQDGHHRISVANAMGQVEIEARIVN